VNQATQADAVLISRCRENDKQAFNEIVARYKDRIRSYVRGMVSNAEDAEDLAQETFVRAYSALGSFESRATLHTWLFRIATNLCIDYRRRTAHSTRKTLSLDQSICAGTSPALDLADSKSDPALLVGELELAALIDREIANLPDRLRAVVLLHDIEGLRYDEVAQVLKCPLGTVKSRLFHARMALRNALLPYLRGDLPTRPDAEKRP
jgi:RNA polymerase sigma-70 factor (ECF subfamily)